MRSADTRNIIGTRGENICYTLLTKFVPNRGILFQPQFLGEKWPDVDFIVELLDAGDARPFFFVQVKTTEAGYTDADRRLKVTIERAKAQGLMAYPAPTYLIGIDNQAETGFVVSMNGESVTGHSTMTTQHPLDVTNLALLWEEVRGFWVPLSSPKLTSRFVDSRWT